MSGGHPVPQGYQPQFQGQADQQFGGLMQAIQPYLMQNMQAGGQQTGFANQMANNPYAAGAQASAGQAGQASGALGNAAMGGAGQLFGAGGAGLGYANQALQAGFDPQNELYAREFQKMQDQQNAINSQYGVASSPYGAGVAGDAARNFNIDWQNQQLSRQGQAANTYGSLIGAGAQGLGAGYNLGQGGVNSIFQQGNMPYSQFGQNIGNILGGYGQAFGNVNSAFAPTFSNENALGSYMNIGQGATGLAQSATQANNQRSAATMGGLGDLLGFGLSFL